MTARRRALGGAAAAALVAVLAAGCTATAPVATQSGGVSVAPTTTPTGTATAAPLGTVANPAHVAIVGDSLTAGGGSRLLSQGLDDNTWMTYAQGDGVDYVGGWAKGGTTVETMAANVTPIADVDVLVLMAGTNDVRHHVTFAEASSSYDAIVRVIKPRTVIIGAIPPLNSNAQDAAVYGAQLKQYATDRGWDYVDPWGFARNGRYYLRGTSLDGIHPTTRGYKIVGEIYRAAILTLVRDKITG